MQAASVRGTEEVARLAGGAGSEHGLAGSIDNRRGAQAGRADPAATCCCATGTARPTGRTCGPACRICSERFQKQYNEDRPPEALGQLPPQTVYAPARRPYPEKLCELDYPAYWERRRVHQDGFMKFQGIEVAVLDVAEGRIWRIGAGKKPSRGPLT